MIFELPWRIKAVIQLLTGYTDTVRQAACAAEAHDEAVLARAWPRWCRREWELEPPMSI
ncbi:hypothetical protein [Rhizobium sp. SAFR-030]|uniref:hypothetical protein n=1 Tax=Rhizobium sp. SAFR-030 TaxID=3387277 RepID=UPI003F8160C1